MRAESRKYQPSRPIWKWDREDRYAYYDMHNGTTRMSSDPMERMYGKCGCNACAHIRREWQDIPAPINRQGRDTNSMSSVNLCERKGCKNMATGNAIGALSIVASGEHDAERRNVELCPRCIGEAFTWLDTPVTEETGGAYREGWKPPQDDSRDAVSKATLEQLLAEAFERAMTIQRNQLEGSSRDIRDTIAED